MGLKCHLDTEKQKFLMSLYFDKNAQTPQNDTVNSWRVKFIIMTVHKGGYSLYFLTYESDNLDF